MNKERVWEGGFSRAVSISVQRLTQLTMARAAASPSPLSHSRRRPRARAAAISLFRATVTKDPIDPVVPPNCRNSNSGPSPGG